MKKLLKSSFILLLLPAFVFAQNKRPQFKFGDVKTSDFTPTAYSVDSSANAVYLFDNGISKYEGNNEGYFSVIYIRHTRIRIMNKNGFDAATVSFPLYSYDDNTEDKLDKFEAVTYNLENGKVVQTKIDKSSVFKDKVTKGVVVYKFTFPNMKEGSIVEYRYTVIVPNPGNLRTWTFQNAYPKLWTELDVSIPDIYRFTPYSVGMDKLDYDTTIRKNDIFSILDRGSITSRYRPRENSRLIDINTEVTRNIWGLKNVPALKSEPFLFSTDNYQARIEFMYSVFAAPDSPPKPVMQNWTQISEELLKDESFGNDLSKSNSLYHEELNKLTKDITDPLESAKKIFYYVRDGFECNNNNSIYLTQSLKKVFQSQKGNVADINLTLVAMLRSRGMVADPVMLSTRENGRPPVNYPVLGNYNYVICRLQIDDNYYFLDASQKYYGFNKLKPDCYNEIGRVIATIPVLIYMPADSLKSEKSTTLFVGLDDKGQMGATFSSTLSYGESQDVREKLRNQKQEDFFANIKKAYAYEVKLTNATIDSLKLYDEPIKIQYDISFDFDDDVVYFNPMQVEAYKENPFKSVKRLLPVEMESAVDEMYSMSFFVPDNYTVEELPKSARIKFNEDEGMFEYIISQSGSTINLKSRLVFKVAKFDPADYESLREFYAYVVKKHAEPIVFRKKK